MTQEEIELGLQLRRALAFARDTVSAGTADPSVIELARSYITVGEMMVAQWKSVAFLDSVFDDDPDVPGADEEDDI